MLVACPECSHIAVICAEEGSAFQNVQSIVSELAVNAEAVPCPACDGPFLSAFRAATSDEILVLVSARSTTSNQAAIPTNSTLSVSPSFA